MQITKWSIDCRMQAARSIQSRKIIVVDNKNTAKARDIFLAKSAKMLIFFYMYLIVSTPLCVSLCKMRSFKMKTQMGVNRVNFEVL